MNKLTQLGITMTIFFVLVAVILILGFSGAAMSWGIALASGISIAVGSAIRNRRNRKTV